MSHQGREALHVTEREINTVAKTTDQPLFLFTYEDYSNSPVLGFPGGIELNAVSTAHVGF